VPASRQSRRWWRSFRRRVAAPSLQRDSGLPWDAGVGNWDRIENGTFSLLIFLCKMVIFHSYVKLQEGTNFIQLLSLVDRHNFKMSMIPGINPERKMTEE
jgi:hypothetical protein